METIKVSPEFLLKLCGLISNTGTRMLWTQTASFLPESKVFGRKLWVIRRQAICNEKL